MRIFIEKERRINKEITQKPNIQPRVSFNIDINTFKFLKSICSDTKIRPQRYFSISELIRIALRDFWLIEDSELPEEILEINEPDTRDYLERNGIKVIRTA